MQVSVCIKSVVYTKPEDDSPQKIEVYPVGSAVEIYSIDDHTREQNVTSLSSSEARALLAALTSAITA